jgi:hypothetical protein
MVSALVFNILDSLVVEDGGLVSPSPQLHDRQCQYHLKKSTIK